MLTLGRDLFQKIILACSIGFFLSPFISPTFARAQKGVFARETEVFDGQWWRASGPAERVGFLYALDDCLTYDARPRSSFTGSWDDYEQKITTYFGSSERDPNASVQAVFVRFGERPAVGNKPSLRDRYGDEFWRSHTKDGRRGFLEGYFSCERELKTASRWSKPLSYYMEKLDDLYNADDRRGDSVKEYPGSVASALARLRDIR